MSTGTLLSGLKRVAEPRALTLVEGASDGVLAQLHRDGASAHPTLRLSADAFVTHLGRALRRTGQPYPLASLNAADLFLSAACLDAQPLALEYFEKQPLRRALLKVDAAQRDEVKQLALEKLLIGARPRLLEYSGQGALLVWLQLVVRRLAMNLGRGQQQRETPITSRVAERASLAVLLAQTPELDIARRTAQTQVVKALQQTLASMEPKERELLTLFHLQGVPHERIGEKLGAPRSTVAHWLTRARQKLLEGTRRRLAENLKLTDSELDSLVDAMGSRMDVSVNLSRLPSR